MIFIQSKKQKNLLLAKKNMEKIESLQKNAKQMLRHTKTKCMPPLTIDVLQSKSAEEYTSKK